MNLKGHINDLVFPIIKLFLKRGKFTFRNKNTITKYIVDRGTQKGL